MTKSKNKVFNYIILFVLVPMLLLSLFVAIPKTNKMKVYADYVEQYYSYTSSTLYLPLKRDGTSNSSNAQLDYINWNIVLSSSANGVTLDISSCTGFLFVDPLNWQGTTFNFKNARAYYFDSSRTQQTINLSYNSSQSSFIYTLLENNSTTSTLKYSLVFQCSENFNCDISSVELGNENNGTDRYNFVRYTDINNGTFTIKFYVRDVIEESGLLSYRIYYLSPDLTDNQIYDSGYQDGYNAGNFDGNSQGYQDGYNAGNSVGYQDGYVAGLEDSNKYSFNSLIGAVIDAPVSAFTSLLNFEILGFNILGFITGLLTLALIVFIIKLCLGGK